MLIGPTFLVETENGDPLVLAGDFEGQQVAVMTFALQESNSTSAIAMAHSGG